VRRLLWFPSASATGYYGIDWGLNRTDSSTSKHVEFRVDFLVGPKWAVPRFGTPLRCSRRGMIRATTQQRAGERRSKGRGGRPKSDLPLYRSGLGGAASGVSSKNKRSMSWCAAKRLRSSTVPVVPAIPTRPDLITSNATLAVWIEFSTSRSQDEGLGLASGLSINSLNAFVPAPVLSDGAGH
jgi:hypothetical protein